jgi:tetratricopeptide (TPR) repeat protein
MTRTKAVGRAFSAAAAVLLLIFLGRPVAAQTQARESDVAQLLVQAEEYVKKGDDKLAIGCYLEAAALSQSRLNLSQSYFGLALCYHRLHEGTAALKYIRKVLEVDPKKEISELFYPADFVRMFNQARAEAGVAGPTEQLVVPKPVPEKTEPSKAEADKAARDAQAKAEAEKARAQNPPAAKPTPAMPAAAVPPPVVQEDYVAAEDRSGHWEIGAHYSKWSVNFVRSLFEDTLKSELAEEIQTQIVKKSSQIQAGLVKLNFTHDLSFDSDGSNFGLEVRYYSRGRTGTFSLGMGLEKTDLSLILAGPLTQEYSNGAKATVEASTKLVSSPFSMHVNFRWEVGSEAILSPYFTLGFGFAPLKATLSYNFTGTFEANGYSETITDAKEKTLDELSADVDFRFPDVLVIFQMTFGLKAQLYRGLYLLGEAGIWDGIILRGGLSYRF